MDSSEVTESLHEWEQIQSPIFHMSPAIQSQEWESDEDDGGLSVSAPDSHEGLQIPCPLPPTDSQSPIQPKVEDEEKELSPSDSRSYGEFLRPRFENLKSGVAWIASRIRYCALCGHGLWPLAAAAAAAAAVVFYWRVRRRGYWVREGRDSRLELLIKKKDQKINQLLLQIAQMNEILLARRKVAVLRIG